MSAAEKIAAARTFLFVPASRPDRFAKAHESGADVVILDLEDAVAPDAKPSALAAAVSWFAAHTGGPPTMVRINGVGTPWHADEVDALSAHRAPLMVPKAESAEDIDRVYRRAGDVPLMPLIETPRGVLRAETVAAADGVVRLAFGHIDLAAALGVDPDFYDAFRHARSQLVLAGASVGRAAPVDGVTAALGDDERLKRDVEHAVALGFRGKLCIHPRQIVTTHRVFRPTEHEVAWAERIVAAVVRADGDAPGVGAIALDGRMVDPPVVARAMTILRWAAS